MFLSWLTLFVFKRFSRQCAELHLNLFLLYVSLGTQETFMSHVRALMYEIFKMWKFSGNFNNLPRHFLYFSSSCVHITRFDGENNVRINMTITLLYSDYSGLYLHWYTQTHVPVLQFSGQHLICLHLHLFSVSLLPPPSSFLMVCPPHQGSWGCFIPP